MAHVYVDSAATGSGTGADWTNAYTTLGAALAAKAAGDNFWVASGHSETQATDNTLVNPGTLATPCTVISVDKTGSTPPVEADLLAGATLITTGNSDIRWQGSFYMWGFTYNCGTGANATQMHFVNVANNWQHFENCTFLKLGTSLSINAIRVDGDRRALLWTNCVVGFGHSGDRFMVDTGQAVDAFIWRYTDNAINVATATPTTLFRTDNSGDGGTAYCIGVDFTNLGANSLWNGTAQKALWVRLQDCKLPASVVLEDSGYPYANVFELIRCDSGGTNYRSERYMGAGNLTTETTVVRTGGASDGTTPIAWKVVTHADADWQVPFTSFPINIWQDTTASTTVTIYGTWGGGAVPNNDECWFEVTYLDSAADSQGALAQNGLTTYMDAAVAQTADAGSTWGGGTTDFKMTTTFTPAQKGKISIVIKCAKPSDTFYFDPKPELS